MNTTKYERDESGALTMEGKLQQMEAHRATGQCDVGCGHCRDEYDS